MAYQGNTVLWRLLERDEAKKRAEDAEMQMLSDKLYQAQQHEQDLDMKERDRASKMAMEREKMAAVAGRDAQKYEHEDVQQHAELGHMQGVELLKRAMEAQKANKAKLDTEAQRFSDTDKRHRAIATQRTGVQKYGHELDFLASTGRTPTGKSVKPPEELVYKNLSTEIRDAGKAVGIAAQMLAGGEKGFQDAHKLKDSLEKGLSRIRGDLGSKRITAEMAQEMQAALYADLLPYPEVLKAIAQHHAQTAAAEEQAGQGGMGGELEPPASIARPPGQVGPRGQPQGQGQGLPADVFGDTARKLGLGQ